MAEESEARPNVGVGSVEPDDFDVVPYWRAEGRFERLRPAAEGEWLNEFPEPGQTVDEYFGSAPNAVTVYRRTLYIRPLGRIDPVTVDLLAEYVSIYFGLETAILEPLDPSAHVVSRRGVSQSRQWHTTDLHYVLHETSPPDAYATLGVTMTDLYPGEDWEFVFGHARFKERVAVMSGHRYGASDRTTFLERMFRVATHELSHAFGILHCVHYRCMMNGVNSVAESDRTPLQMCPIDLRKVQTAVGFHPEERYRRLAAFYKRNGLIEGAMRVENLIHSAQNPNFTGGIADAATSGE